MRRRCQAQGVGNAATLGYSNVRDCRKELSSVPAPIKSLRVSIKGSIAHATFEGPEGPAEARLIKTQGKWMIDALQAVQ